MAIEYVHCWTIFPLKPPYIRGICHALKEARERLITSSGQTCYQRLKLTGAFEIPISRFFSPCFTLLNSGTQVAEPVAEIEEAPW